MKPEETKGWIIAIDLRMNDPAITLIEPIQAWLAEGTASEAKEFVLKKARDIANKCGLPENVPETVDDIYLVDGAFSAEVKCAEGSAKITAQPAAEPKKLPGTEEETYYPDHMVVWTKEYYALCAEASMSIRYLDGLMEAFIANKQAATAIRELLDIGLDPAALKKWFAEEEIQKAEAEEGPGEEIQMVSLADLLAACEEAAEVALRLRKKPLSELAEVKDPQTLAMLLQAETYFEREYCNMRFDIPNMIRAVADGSFWKEEKEE